MKTALFGGSFDPVHRGHENVVRSLLEEGTGIDRVIIMPAFVNPFKSGANTKGRATSQQRYEMCRTAFGEYDRCSVSDYEITREELSYTVLTLEYLQNKYPHDELVLTVGSDSLESLPMWYRSEDIFRMAEIAAVSRSEEDTLRMNSLADRVREKGGKVTIINTEPFEISSTDIRRHFSGEKILKNPDLYCYMNENVVKYITDNHIYGGV